MEIRPLPADEAALGRYVEALWLPYHRELEAIVDDHALADGVDLVAEEAAYRRELLETSTHRAWVAVDVPPGADSSDEVPIEDLSEDALAGFVTADVDEAPSVFDRPDRLVVGDLYVREPYRGTGLARDLLERAAARAREVDCTSLALDVDADNERAAAFYEKAGFETRRRRLTLPVDDL